ncbi:hypothetical protein [Kutzneria sp. NPDC052558]|uniref:hypothetical protein n=1 Tax=Kutzneria sp. NPDC052558 TaxID=3364121 RepID=UPI0037C56BE2
MALGSKLLAWAGEVSGVLPKVVCVEAGHSLLVHLEQRLSQSALTFARAIAKDPDHTVVVIDVPTDGPVALWQAIESILRKRRGSFRIVLGEHTRETAMMTAQWLAERLGRAVVVPDGDVVMGAGGTLFSPPLGGAGWFRFEKAFPPRREARRFPEPAWVFAGVEHIWRPGPVSLVEPLPAGVWVRAADSPDDSRPLLVSSLPTDRELLTVVLGAPRARPVPLAEIAQFCRSVPPESRDRLRFLQYGPVAAPRPSVGQALADHLGLPVTCYGGAPTAEGDLRVIGLDGRPGWRSFARELQYRPRIAGGGRILPPEVVACDSPVPGAAEMSPGVFWYSSDAVVEVVQSGLWMRPPSVPVEADMVRSAPVDPTHGNVVFDTGSPGSADRMQTLARELVHLLDPAVRRMFRVLPADAVVAAGRRVAATSTANAATIQSRPNPSTNTPLLPGRSMVDTRKEVAAPAPPRHVVPLQAAAAPAMPPLVVDVATPPQPALAAERTTVISAATIAAAAPTPPVTPFDDDAPGTEILRTPPPVNEDVVAPALPAGLRLESPAPGLEAGRDAAREVAPAVVAAQVVAEPVAVPANPVPTGNIRLAFAAQPVPAAAASAVPPTRGLAEERAWLRKALNDQYDVAASTVSRMLSEVPGLRVGMEADEVLADLVAVRLYLTGDTESVDRAVRGATPGPHVPMARCVSSGLRRLPSFRGATQLWAAAGPSELDWYRDRALVSEWAFLTASTSSRPPREGEIEFRIWAMTARRTQLIDARVADRVLFVPGTGFKVLDVRDEPTPVVLLRELSSAEIGEDGQVNAGRSMFDDLALNGLDQAAQEWAARPDTTAPRLTATAPPGLVSLASERTSA